MSSEKRELKDIKYDLKIIMSNKLSISQSKLLLMGIIYEIILNKELFPRNSQLKEFINEHLINYLNKEVGFKDYLFKTRTVLAAMIQKEIYINLSYNDVMNLVEEIYKILPDSIESKNKKESRKDTNKAISEWLNFLNEKDK